MRCEERCEKMQEVLMTETEYKVQSDRKHEALMHKWKQQLEIKAREFEVLQKNLAPPKDLDQLRLAIQDELDAADDRAADMHSTDKLRRMELDKETLVTENHKLRQELEEADATKFATQMTDVLGKLTNVDLELKATARQKLREATDDAMRLREQVKQKDLLLVDNHNLHSSKLRELRAELEADKVQFKQKQLDWMDQIASLQLALQQSDESFQKREKEWHLEQAKQVALQSHGDTHTQHTTAALQAKYLEDDLVKLTDERTNDKQSFEKSQAHLQAQLDETLAASFNARRSLADEHKKVADKLTKSLVKAERKRDAYKEKCLQVHERYKAAAMAKEAAAVQLQQLKDQHHIEIQQFLTQWSHAEDSRLSGSMPGKPVVCWCLDMTWQTISLIFHFFFQDMKLDSFLAEIDQYNQIHSPRLS
ncbi:hypothetical protein DYB35_003999 [Aphanomyces astaci]|nr:hypothetical protein DYB35_003999 [Aphanomyces astaci]